MTMFCTSCGNPVDADARFCTVCGAARAPAAEPTAAIATPVENKMPPEKKQRRTWPWWVLVVIAFFLLGLWLGRGPAAKKPLCGGPASVQGGGGERALQGPGKPAKVGRGGPGDVPGFSGGGGNMKIPPGQGGDGLGVDGDADTPGSGGGGKETLADDNVPSSSSSGTGDQLKRDLLKYSQGKGGVLGDADDADAKLPPQGKSYSANDFTYDKTNLPRYPDANTAVVSSVSYGPDGRTDTYSTGAGIVTSSSFDQVVNWYRQNLPPGWRAMTIGDMQQLSKQLSAGSLTQMLGGQPGNAPITAGAADAPATAPLRLSIFSPPAGSPSKSGIMIVQHGDEPVEALLQAKIAPPS
jgi:hypothetical protein